MNKLACIMLSAFVPLTYASSSMYSGDLTVKNATGDVMFGENVHLTEPVPSQHTEIKIGDEIIVGAGRKAKLAFGPSYKIDEHSWSVFITDEQYLYLWYKNNECGDSQHLKIPMKSPLSFKTKTSKGCLLELDLQLSIFD